MSLPELPEHTHVYRNHLLNSTHWDLFVPRDDDIIICSAYSAGSTWVQTIVATLVFRQENLPAPVMELSPWVDRYSHGGSVEALTAMLDDQDHRRILESHVPLNALRFFPQCKYIVVARDGRDVFMSLWARSRNYSAVALERLRAAGEELGEPWPARPDDLEAFWAQWLTESSVAWESDGYLYGSMFQHVASWWPYRELPNVLLVHYRDLMEDLESQVERIAAFLEIPVRPGQLPGLLPGISFAAMSDKAEDILGVHAQDWRGGAESFFARDSVGAWSAVLDPEALRLFDAALTRNLEPEAARWLQGGEAPSARN